MKILAAVGLIALALAGLVAWDIISSERLRAELRKLA